MSYAVNFKFKLGEKAFFIHGSKVEENIIDSISFIESSKDLKIEYLVNLRSGVQKFVDQELLFPTKKELLESL